MSHAACPCCGCAEAGASRVHAIAAALREGDLDAAMTLGLLEPGAACMACAPQCRANVDAARTARQQALAARERHRARAQRLARRERERAERRAPVAPATGAGAAAGAGTAVGTDGAAAAPAAPLLPPAAAAALARAKARAAATSRR